MAMRSFFGSVLAALVLAGAGASAGEFVDIESGTRGEPARLIGYMARPPGPGPFPAVVLLHGCGGFHSSMVSWADRLSRFGFVALAVDSFGPRGIDEQCSGGFPEQVTDAYAALRQLATRPFVKASHVALMGFSQGGLSVLTALEKAPPQFRAGIAFYPICQYASGIMTAPVLVLIGGADTWTPAASCEAMAAGRSELGAPRGPGDRSSVELVVYPGAHHNFDVLDLALVRPPGLTAYGHRVAFDEEATRDSIARVREFLQRTIGER
jgi:dienelactone hydrolase